MRSPNTRLALVLVSSLVLGACAAMGARSSRPSQANEPASVAIAIKGKNATKVRSAIERELAKRYSVVPGKQYETAARRLKARKLNAKQVAKVAADLGVDAVLTGTLRKKGKKRYLLAMSLREGGTGKVVERFTLELKSRKLRSSDRATLIADVSRVLDEMVPIERFDGPRDQDEDSSDSKEAVAAQTDNDAAAPAEPRPAKPARPEAKPARPEAKPAAVATSPKSGQAGKGSAKSSPPVVAKKPAKPAAAPAKPAPPPEEPPPAIDVEYDNDGQAIDDEVPNALSKK